MEKLSLVIFDWSGTISDDRKPVLHSLNNLLEEYGLRRLTLEEIYEAYDITLGKYLRDKGLNINDREALHEFKRHYEITTDSGINPEVYEKALLAIPEIVKRKNLCVLSSHPESSLKSEAK